MLLLPMVCWVPPMHQIRHAGLLLASMLRHAMQLRAGHAGHPLDLLGRPLRDLGADLVHAPDPLADVFLVLPAVLEDVPEDAPDDRHVGARAEPDDTRRRAPRCA